MNRRDRESADREAPFPVLQERSLSYIPRKFMRGARRSLEELPEPRPGTVLVFHHGTRYDAFNEERHLTGAEEAVVDATAVFLVDMRARDFTVDVNIPSVSAADDFTALVTFIARVSDAEKAAREGAIKLRRYLRAYLGRDSRLSKLGSAYRVEEISKVRELVISRIEAYCELKPISIPGLTIDLTSSNVLTPREVREHERRKRDEVRHQEISQLHAKGEGALAAFYEAIVDKGPAALTGLGLSRGDTPVGEAIGNAREDERLQQEQLAEAIRIFQKNGLLDYMDVDPNDILTAYLQKLTGQSIPRASHQEVAGSNKSAAAIEPGPDDDPEFDFDDDDE